MSAKNRQTYRRYEDEYDRRAIKAYKIQQREYAEKQYTSYQKNDIINMAEDDDLDEYPEDDLQS